MNRKLVFAAGIVAAVLVLASGGYGIYRIIDGGSLNDQNKGAAQAGEGNSSVSPGSDSTPTPTSTVAAKSALECGVPPTPSLAPGLSPPPEQPIGAPKNDFPIVLTISPKKGDVGTTVSAKVVVPRPQALIVVVARFIDNENHELHEAKFTNAAGIADFKLKIPKDAPMGVTFFYASATHNNKSALDAQKFTVTGPGCP